VRHSRRCARLLPHALEERCPLLRRERQIVPQQLDGDVSFEDRIFGEQDPPHGTAAEQAGDAVTPDGGW
jgi:hypothetical protein